MSELDIIDDESITNDKYWCILSDTEMSKQLDQLLAAIEKKTKQKLNDLDGVDHPNGNLDENMDFDAALDKILLEYIPVGGAAAAVGRGAVGHADDFVRATGRTALKVGQEAAGHADDFVRSTGRAALKAGQTATNHVDDAGRAAAKAGQTAAGHIDDVGRAAGQAAGHADDAARGAGQAAAGAAPTININTGGGWMKNGIETAKWGGIAYGAKKTYDLADRWVNGPEYKAESEAEARQHPDWFKRDAEGNLARDENGQLIIDPSKINDVSYDLMAASIKAGKTTIEDYSFINRMMLRFRLSRDYGGWKIENMVATAVACYGLWKMRDWIIPQVKKMWKYSFGGKCLAKCTFNSDGNEYMAYFDMKEKKWMLKYMNSKLTSTKPDPSRSDCNSFFSTKHFKKFATKCGNDMDKYLNDDTFRALMAAMNTTKGDILDSSTKKFLADLATNRKQIIANVKNGKY